MPVHWDRNLDILETSALLRLEIRVNNDIYEAVSCAVKANRTADFLCRSYLKVTFVEESKSNNWKVSVMHTSTF
jgi:hypothetical protein